MSKVLEQWPASSNGTKYPWNTWLDGRIHKITHGEDFTCVYDAMRVALYRSAKTRGVRVKTSYNREENSMIVQAYGPGITMMKDTTGEPPETPPMVFGDGGTVERGDPNKKPGRKKAAGKK